MIMPVSSFDHSLMDTSHLLNTDLGQFLRYTSKKSDSWFYEKHLCCGNEVCLEKRRSKYDLLRNLKMSEVNGIYFGQEKECLAAYIVHEAHTIPTSRKLFLFSRNDCGNGWSMMV